MDLFFWQRKKTESSTDRMETERDQQLSIGGTSAIDKEEAGPAAIDQEEVGRIGTAAGATRGSQKDQQAEREPRAGSELAAGGQRPEDDDQRSGPAVIGPCLDGADADRRGQADTRAPAARRRQNRSGNVAGRRNRPGNVVGLQLDGTRQEGYAGQRKKADQLEGGGESRSAETAAADRCTELQRAGAKPNALIPCYE
jgi:hypothetical protein